MTCIHCGENVPAVPSTDDVEGLVCLACKSLVIANPTGVKTWRFCVPSQRPGDPLGQPSSVDSNPPQIGSKFDWISRGNPTRPTVRIDHWAADTESASASSSSSQSGIFLRRSRFPLLQWIAIGTGLGLFTCGAILIANSIASDRVELWDLGAPIVLAGQIVFLIGLVLQLDLIYYLSMHTSRELNAIQHSSQSDDNPRNPTDTTPCATEDDANRPDAATLMTDLREQLDELGGRLRAPDLRGK